MTGSNPRPGSPKPSVQRGSATVFGLGLSVVILAVAGLSIDLWQVIAQRQDLMQRAESAAAAGANQIDFAQYRTDGTIVLDPGSATAAAKATLSGGVTGSPFVVGPIEVQDDDGDGLADDMVITLTREVDFALLGILSSTDSVTITARAVASPVSTAP